MFHVNRYGECREVHRVVSGAYGSVGFVGSYPWGMPSLFRRRVRRARRRYRDSLAPAFDKGRLPLR